MTCSYKNCTTNLPSNPIYPCLYCNLLYYCSINCRILDWESIHKKACAQAPAHQFTTPDKLPETSFLNTSTISSSDSAKKRCLDDFEMLNPGNNRFGSDLGKGAFGQVKLVREKANPNNLYALKIMNKRHILAHGSLELLKREIRIQRKLDHPHVIKLQYYFEDKENVYLVLEYAENGNLFFYLRKKKKFTEKEAFVYFFQTCIGIDYLHKKGVLHRDLKPENLLLDKRYNIKLCDFGYSAEDIGKRNTFCGTVDYMAPEVVQKKNHNYKVDIWSLGVLLYELTHGYAPFKGCTNDEKFKSILENKIKFEGISDDAKDLICNLLKGDPEQRPGCAYIFKHRWLQTYAKELKIDIKSYIYTAPSTAKKPSDILVDQTQSPKTPTKNLFSEKTTQSPLSSGLREISVSSFLPLTADRMRTSPGTNTSLHNLDGSPYQAKTIAKELSITDLSKSLKKDKNREDVLAAKKSLELTLSPSGNNATKFESSLQEIAERLGYSKTNLELPKSPDKNSKSYSTTSIGSLSTPQARSNAEKTLKKAGSNNLDTSFEKLNLKIFSQPTSIRTSNEAVQGVRRKSKFFEGKGELVIEVQEPVKGTDALEKITKKSKDLAADVERMVAEAKALSQKRARKSSAASNIVKKEQPKTSSPTEKAKFSIDEITDEEDIQKKETFGLDELADIQKTRERAVTAHLEQQKKNVQIDAPLTLREIRSYQNDEVFTKSNLFIQPSSSTPNPEFKLNDLRNNIASKELKSPQEIGLRIQKLLSSELTPSKKKKENDSRYWKTPNNEGGQKFFPQNQTKEEAPRTPKSQKDFEAQREVLLKAYRDKWNQLSTTPKPKRIDDPDSEEDEISKTDSSPYSPLREYHCKSARNTIAEPQSSSSTKVGSDDFESKVQMILQDKKYQSSQSPYKPPRKDEISGRMEDFELDVDNRVSRPSQKIMREMPQHKAQSQKTYRLGFFERLSSIVGCTNDRNDVRLTPSKKY